MLLSFSFLGPRKRRQHEKNEREAENEGYGIKQKEKIRTSESVGNIDSSGSTHVMLLVVHAF